MDLVSEFGTFHDGREDLTAEGIVALAGGWLVTLSLQPRMMSLKAT